MNEIKAFYLLLFSCFVINSYGQNQWDIQFTQSNLDCANNQVCYQLELQNTAGTDWTIGDQNYRLFFDGDFMTVTSVSSLLPTSFYGNVSIDQNIKISGQGQEAASPLDDIDDNLGFLDFSIVQTDKSNPSAATQITNGAFTPVAEICVDVTNDVINDNTETNCLAFYHSRPSTAGAITNQYSVVSENNTPNGTIAATGVNYDDLNSDDGAEACVGGSCDPCASLGGDTDSDGLCDQNDCAPNDANLPATPGTTCDDNNPMTTNDQILPDGCSCQGTPISLWDIQLTQSNLDCSNNQVCYQLALQNTMGTDWTIGDQNYRLLFDGDFMTITSVSSLLPTSFYGNASIDQNIKINGQGQEAASPLDDIDNNLGFLDFSIVQTDKSNPSAATQITTGTFTPVAEICVDVINGSIDDLSGSKCLSLYHSRPATAGNITNQYTTISENNLPNNTVSTTGVNYTDITPANSSASCVGYQCGCEAIGQTLSH